MLTVTVTWADGTLSQFNLADYEELGDWENQHHGEYTGLTVKSDDGGDAA